MKVGGGGAGSHARLGDADRRDAVTEIRTELTDLVVAARNGDRHAEQQLLAAHLPMLYRIVGRALGGHADVDDVVQETVLRAHRDLPSLRAPASFRSWLVAIAMRQTSSRLRAWQQDRERTAALDDAADLPDPDAEFAEVTLLRLGMSAQRRQVAHAARWLDRDDQELAALWWQELMGDLGRPEVVAALGIGAAHARVRLQRMRHQLELSRHLVAALEAEPPCPELEALTAGWDGVPGPRWRKRFARHVRDCPRCGSTRSGLIPVERLLLGGGSLALVPIGDPATAAGAANTAGAGAGGWLTHLAGVKVAAVVAVGATVSGGVYLTLPSGSPDRSSTAPVVRQTPSSPPSAPPPSAAAPTLLPAGRVVIRPAGRPGTVVTLNGEDLVTTTGGAGTRFILQPGMADPACVSLRTADGRYVRHSSFRIVVSRAEDRQLFRQDATFCAQRGAEPGTVRLTSSNYSDRFVRVQNDHFALVPAQTGAGYVEETSFTLTTD
ncbi:sigma-70 family RNA polymerase sigma factor [Actinoplanes sp. NPDC023801]|uniref:sigma-70 family RNA polymerase sigma factor n=1 Tax=Actinoplanes sp. NPDC023801 TaxID=3154595 RepID=UPI0033F964BD